MRPLALLLLALLALAPATALAAAPRADFNDIEDEVMCVSCGVPLTIAESPQAERERALIRRLIARGLTKDQIKAELVATYTDRVIATPKDSGFGLTAYLVPIILVVGAAGALAIAAPRWRRRRGVTGDDDNNAPGHAAPELSADDAERLDRDLARYEV
jgi:cytochrome c-type biogenesis protein CcmH